MSGLWIGHFSVRRDGKNSWDRFSLGCLCANLPGVTEGGIGCGGLYHSNRGFSLSGAAKDDSGERENY